MIKRRNIVCDASASDTVIAVRIGEINTLASDISHAAGVYKATEAHMKNWNTVDHLELVVARLEEIKEFLL